jgi:hypothetical protein
MVMIDAEVLKNMPLEFRALRRGTREPRATADAAGALLPFEHLLRGFAGNTPGPPIPARAAATHPGVQANLQRSTFRAVIGSSSHRNSVQRLSAIPMSLKAGMLTGF